MRNRRIRPGKSGLKEVIALIRVRGMKTSFPKRVAYMMKLIREVERDKGKLAEMI